MNTAIAKIPFIPGYTIIEKIFRSTRTDVYRALWGEQQQLVVIKVLRHEHPNLSELVHFRNQFAIARHLNHSAIARPIALERCGNGHALVMPDEGFIALSTYWQQCDHIGTNLVTRIPTVLAIAIQLADTLHYLAGERIIHKDIKPDNILIHPETKQIQLSDFGIASLIPKERQQLSNPKVLEGTLAYMSPEQTGRMNRGIDYRTDFYSLGVTLFELLTGELPFVTTEPLELVHCHIARPVMFPDASQATIPEMVRAIVVKLMAKNAEDRYQSALGLKYDLTICLQQWKIAGTVAAFELGQHDVCDRFLIPEALYGREGEVQVLLDAFGRVAVGNTELVLVAGPSGIGKTAVVNEVHKPITRQQGYFIKGKFDQFNRNIPFLAFAQALQDLMGQLLAESDAQLAEWRTKILSVVGENGQVLIDVVPILERVIGTQPSAVELSGLAAQQRFNRLFQRLIALFATAEHPLVMFLDDLQWADSASLQLIKLLMSYEGYFLLIGAYRDHEVLPTHPLHLVTEELQKNEKAVDILTLKALSLADTNQIIAETFCCSRERSHLLAELIDRKTQGNPFFIIRLLKTLHEDGFVQFDRWHGHWVCNISQLDASYLTDDVVEFIAQQLQRLSPQTQRALKLAACLGNQFDLTTLSLISEQSETETATALWQALQEEFILPVSETYKLFQDAGSTALTETVLVPYKFLHDQVQQAAYTLIPEAEKLSTHLRIGKLMLDQLSEIEIEQRLFDIVNNISLGQSLITAPAEQYQLSRLLLRAAHKARATTAYTVAAQYCQTGIYMLGQQAWQEQRTLIRELYEVGAEVAYLNSDFEKSDALTTFVLEKAGTVLEKIRSYEIRILAFIIQNRTPEALQVGFEILSELNINFPSNPGLVSILLGFLKTKLLLGRRSVNSLEDSVVMKDPLAKARSAILKTILPAAYISAPNHYPLLIFKQIELLLKHGNNDAAPSAYCSYSVILSSFLGDIETGYQFGELALKIMENPSIVQKVEAGVIFTVYALIRPWKHHLHESHSFLFENYHRALDTGENEYAAWSVLAYLRNTRSTGIELNENAKQHVLYIKALETTQRSAVIDYAYPSYRFTLKLLDQNEALADLDSQGLSRCSLTASLMEADDRSGLCAFYLYDLMLAYWLTDFDRALEALVQCQKYVDSIIGFYEVQQFWWFATLTWLAVYPQSSQRQSLLKKVQQGRKKLKKWACHAPMNALHKFHLVEAERYRILQQQAIAADFYDRAICGAKDHGYIQEEALANELAAKFYLEWGKEKAAAGYMQAAYYCYAHWGARVKTNDLETRYPHLLQPILQQPTLNPLTTLEIVAAPNLSNDAVVDSSRVFDYQSSKALDFATVLKASQALSKSVQLDELLHQLTQMILQSSGGDRCTLILSNGDGLWQIRAIATPETIELCTAPLEGNPNHPLKLIQYVKNTQEVVVVDDLKTDLPIIDEYLSQNCPKSVLCLPILNQKRLIGIVQLSNQSTSGVFTYDRILTLNFLCTQAAISLENARLYHILEDYSQTLEGKVEERTIALQEKEERLRLALSATNQGFFDVNLQTGEAVVSPEYALMLGYDPATFHETDAAWRARLHPDDYERTSQAYRAYAAGQIPQYKVEFRQRTRQGTWKWILAMGKFIAWDDAGKPIRLLGTHRDISDRKFAEIQLEAQNTLLAQIAQGHSLSSVLNTLIETVEQTLDGVLCSILLVDNDDRLRYCAAPSLPDAYGQAVDGLLIGDGVGSCGTAAFRNETIIVADIATDSLWCPYKDLALSHGLRACWSSPITARGGQVLGTFAMYYKQVRSPQAHELSWIKQMAYIAGIAIERQEADTKLRQSEAKLLKAQQVAHVGNWEFDVASQKITWSPEMFRIYELEPAPLAPSYAEYLQLLPMSDRLRLQQYIEQAINEGTPYTIECSRVRSDGMPCHYECRAEAEKDEQGQVIRLFGTTLDITERKQAEIALQNLIAGTATTTGQDFFPALVQHIAQALGVSYAIVTEQVNEQLQTLAFWANGRLMAPHAYPLAQTPCEQVLHAGEFYCESNVQQRFPNDPDLVALEADSYLGIVLRSNQGEAIGHLCILHQQSIANLQQAKQILRVFAARAAAELERQQAESVIKKQLAAIEAAIDGIGILKGDTYLYVNQSHLRLFGYEQIDEMVGHSWKKLYAPDEIKRFEQEVLPQLERDRAWQGEAVATRKDGSTFAQGVSLTLSEDGLLICVCQDISDRKQAQELIIHNALHDPLTDLPNRTLLLERLDLAIQRAKRTDNYRYAVLFLDLDRFKVINDSLGHVVGDQLLVAIAQRLTTHLRQIDLVARLGGDEFLILLEDIRSIDEVAQVAERILADCQTPLTIHDHQIFTSMSIGIVLGKPNYHQATDLIRDADIAMYQAKSHASNSYKFFDTAMHTEAIHRLTLETDLRHALDQQAFTLRYQPIVELSSQRLVGFEALVRWSHPTRGLIAPGAFIPIAEETGLISRIDSWVLHRACQQLASWQRQFADGATLKVSINLSAQDLRNPSLIEDIDTLLAATGLTGQAITLEITESMLIKDIDPIIELLMQLTSRQIQISIDDFGTGYSSLNYLHRLPVHNLKIDRAFVRQMQSEHRNHQVVSTIITLSQQLGLTTIAEGIETPQQLEQLQQLGCQLGQGYLFSQPLAAHEIEARFFHSDGAQENW
ncbi:EAL domain-containing protein [Vacuolonema iberomarrocanum]|uniref:EAL domain-containing protein n=1 Tax=Vacuolonema iberomarrocanum TaxID=3454632 RepID=UPI0019DF4075|nr:EAL domain-containing protein [filamentous cyanobacterium LEGE 07170]